MPERELEQVMKGFYQQRYNVLLCTTIIETGIDVPSANTIVIHRADRFGWPSQLRGRVGRSHHQAYAYLLTPGEDAITSNAKKRLEAIQAMEELGSGFYLAMHDLEIRGTGEVLGDSQSGNIQEVGFSMYNEMLNEAVRCARARTGPGRALQPGLRGQPACARPAALGLLRRRARAPGHLQAPGARGRRRRPDPDPGRADRPLRQAAGRAQTLLTTHRLRLAAQPLGIVKIDASETQALLQFGPKTPVDPARIIELVQRQRHIKLAQDKLRVEIKAQQIPARADAVRAVLRALKCCRYAARRRHRSLFANL